MIAEATVQSKTGQSHGMGIPNLITRPLRPISTDEYHRLIELDFFGPEERLELLEGYLVPKSPIRPQHADATARIYEELVYLFNREVRVRSQAPITLPDENSEPEPDFLILRRRDTYGTQHPDVNDILLIGEVSDSTLVYDRTTKLSIYARANIPEYWILNLKDRRLEVYREPEISADRSEGTYRIKLTFEPEESVAPLAFPDKELSLIEVFPP